ncbi:MAG: DUF3160 domain-containing protein [Armatimonadota bacterium]|nr:DUF3160 domain-containing protein [Armatimonadota bacterium]
MRAVTRVVLVTLVVMPMMLGCGDGEEQAAEAAVEMQIPDFDPQAAFRAYYEPVAVEVHAQVPGYDLPLDLEQVVNTEKLQHLLRPEVREMLSRQGFVVTDRGSEEDIVDVYDFADDAGIPPFVTVDTLLHLYHLQFDQTLKNIEEREFYQSVIDFSHSMLDIAQQQHGTLSGDLQDAAERNVAYFAVGLRLLDPSAEIPGLVQEDVSAELALIEEHAGFADSPIFTYREDYSQYVPRGHYTRSETLERYFKALMWYGRLSMLLKGGDDAIVTEQEARIQTLQACLITGSLYEPDNAELLQTWQRIYAVTCFYVGFADDLTPREYAQSIREVAGTSYEWSTLAEEETLFSLRSQLATLRAPRIYGGTGEITIYPPFSPEQLDELLADTMGLRLMGQRFIPDGYMMQELGAPSVLDFTGEGKPFSMEMTAGGPARVFPRGLDVMAVLGSERAHEILEAEGDTAYANYEEQLESQRAEFGEVSDEDWNRNLYWSWLRALQTLGTPVGEGYPSFMRTDAWLDRSLWAALASWAELRHDTILYAKQPYMPTLGAAPMPQEEPPPGYVEPRPDFYAQMLALARMTRAGLQDMDVLDAESLGRLEALEGIIERLMQISLTELRGEAISEEDAQYIKGIAASLERTIAGMDEEEDKTTIVADVLTDQNTRQVLEEGVGYVKLLITAYQVPDGRIALGVGPVLSYYEFKHPIGERLTDEAWRELLQESPPDEPGWTESFFVARQ